MSYFDAIQDTTHAEVTTPDGAVWRLQQPRGRDFDRWQELYLLMIAPAASKLLGTKEQDLLDAPEGPERTAALEAALERQAADEWATLTDDEKDRRRSVRDEQDAALVIACVTHCTPPGADAPARVRFVTDTSPEPTEGVQALHFWRVPISIRQALIRAARRQVSGEALRRQVDSFRSGPGASGGDR